MGPGISREELIGPWSLTFADIDFVNSKPILARLGIAVQLKFFATNGFFATDFTSIPTDDVAYVAEQLGVGTGEVAGYDLSGRTARRHCGEILQHLGFRRMRRADRQELTLTVVFEDVERLVFYFPARPRAGGEFDDIFPRDRQRGDESTVISDLVARLAGY